MIQPFFSLIVINEMSNMPRKWFLIFRSMIEEFDEQEILMNKENQKLMNLFSFLV